MGERLLNGAPNGDDGLTTFDAVCMSLARLEREAISVDLLVSNAQFRNPEKGKSPIYSGALDSLRTNLFSREPPVQVEDELAAMERLLNTPKAERVRPPMPEPDPN